jgi:STE24 endopeptidase
MSTLNQFADAARTLINRAEKEARALGATELEPDHFWLGLLSEREGRAAEILSHLTLEPASLYANLHARLTQEEGAPTEGKIGLSERSRIVVGRTVRLKDTALGVVINPEHFLLALWYEEQSQGVKMLQEAGLTLEDILRQPGLSSADLASLRLEAQDVPPAKPDEASRRRMRRLSLARRYYIPFAWLGWVILVFVLFLVFVDSHINSIGYVLLALFTSEPFLLAQPRPEWFPWFALGIVMFGYSLWYLLCLPLHWVYATVLPRFVRKKVSRSLFSSTLRWLMAYSLNHVFQLAQFLLSFEVVYALFILFPSTWWLMSTLYFALFYLVRVYVLSRFPITLFTRLVPVPEGPLNERLLALLKRTGTRVAGFYVKEAKDAKPGSTTLAANAHLIQWGLQKRIVLTDTFYQKFPLDEQEVILAHELGHLVHQDILRRVGWRTLFSGLTLLAYQQILFATFPTTTRLYLFFLQFDGQGIAKAGLCYGIGVGFFVLHRWLRRRQEYRADEYALQTTQNVEAFKRSKQRLAHYHVWPISNSRFQRLTSTHPTTQQRLTHADAFAQRQAKSPAPLAPAEA